MNRIKRLTFLGFLATAVMVCAVRDGDAASCTVWTQVTSPIVGQGDNVLAALAATSSSDVWAVGQFAPNSNVNTTRTLTQHYDGTSWSVVASPNSGSLANSLFSVAANSGKAWAVGYYLKGTLAAGNVQPTSLIEEWNGTQWGISAHPTPGILSHLFSVSATSPSDVWAVGETQTSNGLFSALIEHFDGTAWSLIPAANPGTGGNHLNSVIALSPTDAWAAGQYQQLAEPDQGLIEHWDGSAWTTVAAPSLGTLSGLFYSLSGTSDDDLFLGGESQSDLSGSRTLVATHAGGAWNLETSASVGTNDDHLYSLSDAGNGVGWTAGSYLDSTSGHFLTLIEGRTASGWVQEPSPSPGKGVGDSQLGGVLAVGASDVWAVGDYDNANALQPLILHRCQ